MQRSHTHCISVITVTCHITNVDELARLNFSSGRYTDDTDLLTPEQRLSYEKDGFILIKGLVSEEDIDLFR